jgi:hypothetical protein
MKRLKLVMAFTAVFVCVNLLTAEKPIDKKIKTIVDVTIDKLNNDVQLTESQKVKFREFATVYFMRIDSINQLSNEIEKISAKQECYNTFNTLSDSLLTQEQLELRKNKIALRKKDKENKK